MWLGFGCRVNILVSCKAAPGTRRRGSAEVTASAWYKIRAIATLGLCKLLGRRTRLSRDSFYPFHDIELFRWPMRAIGVV